MKRYNADLVMTQYVIEKNGDIGDVYNDTVLESVTAPSLKECLEILRAKHDIVVEHTEDTTVFLQSDEETHRDGSASLNDFTIYLSCQEVVFLDIADECEAFFKTVKLGE